MSTVPFPKHRVSVRSRRPIESDVALLIDRICKRRDWSMVDLADAIGCTPSYISRLRSGGKHPSRQFVERMVRRMKSTEEERTALFVVYGFIPPGYIVVKEAQAGSVIAGHPDEV